MFDEPLEKLAQLRDRADVFAQKMGTAQASRGPYHGNDETGVITATVADDGQVMGIVVGADWHRQIGVQRLAAAVQEAVQAASIDRLQVWSEAFVEQDDADAPSPRPMALLGDSFAHRLNDVATARMSSADGEAALRQLLAMAEELESSIDHVSEQLEASMNTSYKGRSQSHNVSVTITGSGELTDVAYDRQWLLDASAVVISRETTEAFREAYRQAGGQTPNDIISRSPLGELKDLGEDPLALARRLNLT